VSGVRFFSKELLVGEVIQAAMAVRWFASRAMSAFWTGTKARAALRLGVVLTAVLGAVGFATWLAVVPALRAQATTSPTPPSSTSVATSTAPTVTVHATGGTQTTPQTTPQTASPGTSAPPFRLSVRTAHDVLYPGDIVRLKIWREPDLSGDFDINAQGVAVFPKIGAVQVTQMTTDSLQHLLIATYSAYLKDPAIEVTPLRRVTVLGAVKNPGLYPIDPTMSIADVLAFAGGPTPDGNQKKLELIRGGKKQDVTISVHQQVAETPIRSGDQIIVPERSWISRNGYVFGAAIGAMTIIVTTIITH
jgi:protein involved in polysaccharide export with SLBB domain